MDESGPTWFVDWVKYSKNRRYGIWCRLASKGYMDRLLNVDLFLWATEAGWSEQQQTKNYTISFFHKFILACDKAPFRAKTKNIEGRFRFIEKVGNKPLETIKSTNKELVERIEAIPEETVQEVKGLLARPDTMEQPKSLLEAE